MVGTQAIFSSLPKRCANDRPHPFVQVAPRKTAIAVPPQAKSQQVALKHKVTPSAAAATTAPPPEGQMPADRWSSVTEARRQSAVQCEPGGNPVYAYSSTWAQPQRHKAGDAREGSTKVPHCLRTFYLASIRNSAPPPLN